MIFLVACCGSSGYREKKTLWHLQQAGRPFLSGEGEVEVEGGGGRCLAGRSLGLLALAVTVAVLLCGIVRTCGR